MIIYPDKPWYDGQEFEHTTSEGQKLTGTYDLKHETWVFRDFRLSTDLVYTDTVYTVNMRPSNEQLGVVNAQFDADEPLPSPGQFTTQQDVNWYLYDLIQTNKGGSNVWVGVTPPPSNPDGTPMFEFWWNPDEELLYYWSFNSDSWELTGMMEFDRPPIVQATPPIRHPKFPNDPLEEGDFWINDQHEIYYWKINSATLQGEWIRVEEKFLEELQADQDRQDNNYNELVQVVQTLVELSSQNESDLKDKVAKAGDTMTGALVMDDAGEILMKDTTLDFVRRGESLKDGNGDPILEDDGQGNMVEQWDDNNERFSHIESLPPQLIKSDGTSGGDTKTPFGIRVEIDDGNTWKNQFKVGNRNGDVVTIQGGTGPNIVLGDFVRKDGAQHGIDNGVLIKNIPTPDRELTPGDYAVNKEYVDREDEILLNGLIDLQEEIDAIAPSLEKGAWEWDQDAFITGNTNRPPAEGKYYLLQGVFPTWTIVDEYIHADAVVFNIKDSSGANHENWDTILGSDPNNPDDNKLILLFDKPDPDKCLGKITDIYDIGEANNPFGNAAIVLFDRTEAFGKPNNKLDDNGKYITFVNIFQEPSGGSASEFVLKKGDKMEGPGPLEIISTAPTHSYNNPQTGQPYIKFENTYNNVTRPINLFHAGHNDFLVVNGGGLMVRNAIYSSGYFYAYDGSLTVNPRILLNETNGGKLLWGSNDRLAWSSDGGQLKVGTNSFLKWTNTDNYLQYRGNSRLYWGSSGVSILKPVNNNTTAVGFKIKGSTIYNNNYGSGSIGSNDGSLLYVQHVNGQSDSIRYKGRQSDDFDLVTVKYVKDNASSTTNYVKTNSTGFSNNLTITKSSGVYYISGG